MVELDRGAIAEAARAITAIYLESGPEVARAAGVDHSRCLVEHVTATLRA